ncbi:hypothetical protein GCM10007973_17880 [Polymorphobacter multimanifer]|uniref:alpha/beta fold hydrolase n=1 Tax=Polymorphobacter multimanifer TaxID=1070431 RepID=UPI001666346C|nr:alpha/beta hydrolase [Polymorphobacter multimanifer]GGI81870.1 hypothetical protein GCM10007973_17880 [Polymorphobacter multimanifer]
MIITRHFIDVTDPDGSRRRVHYRRAGSWRPVPLIHQSPRASAEYEPLPERGAPHFTCPAPDTPGFGESAPLPHAAPDVNAYADAVFAFMDAVGLPRAAAYGFHSGAITLITAAQRAPQRFSAIAAEGYAVWTDAERADLAARSPPPYTLMPYGEHLTWTWSRIREQSWFFPWYAADDAHRLPRAHDDVGHNHAMVMDVLAAGPSYALGYGAMLQAPRDLPAPGDPTPPVLISGYDGDPLQAHIDRLGDPPPGWAAEKHSSPAGTEAAALAWLQARAEPGFPLPRAPDDEGYTMNQLHWLGDRGAGHVHLHAPGSAAEFAHVRGQLTLDLPGHGLSVPEATDPELILALLAEGLEPLATAAITRITGDGASSMLAARLAEQLRVTPDPIIPGPWPRLPDLTPDRFGSHLTRAWSHARAEAAFDPWDAPGAATARTIPAGALDPARLHRRALASLRSRGANAISQALED